MICAPVYTAYEGLTTQVVTNVDDGLKRESGVHCDELVTLRKSLLTTYIGILTARKLRELERALKAALQLEGG